MDYAAEFGEFDFAAGFETAGMLVGVGCVEDWGAEGSDGGMFGGGGASE